MRKNLPVTQTEFMLADGMRRTLQAGRPWAGLVNHRRKNAGPGRLAATAAPVPGDGRATAPRALEAA